MPVFDFLHWTQQTGDTLEASGPLVQVEVSLPQPLEEFYSRHGIQIPNSISGYAMIDTGASVTAVHEQLLLGLGIQPIDSIPTHTPHGPHRSFVYPAKVSFPGMALMNVPMNRLVGCDLNWVTSDGKEVIVLLGRDLLRFFLLVYNGPGSTIILAY